MQLAVASRAKYYKKIWVGDLIYSNLSNDVK